MGFFNRSISKPGPGVERDEPRKKGVLRFFEILSRDFADLVKLNLLFCLCCLPSAVLFFFSILWFGSLASLLFLLLSLAAAFPIGGAASAGFFFITKRMMDDPGFVWYEFRRKFRENWRVAIPVGLFCVFIFYMEIYLSLALIGNNAYAEPWVSSLNLAGLILIGMIAPYIFVQIPYFFLKPLDLFKNSLILAFINFPRSFMGAVQGGIVWALYALFFPASMIFAPLVVLFVFSLSWLLTLMWIWKPVNERFKIEETRLNQQ